MDDVDSVKRPSQGSPKVGEAPNHEDQAKFMRHNDYMEQTQVMTSKEHAIASKQEHMAFIVW